MAALTITPTSGNIVSEKTNCRVVVTSQASNDTSAFNSAVYPTEPQIACYFKAAAAGKPTLKSRIFATDSTGTAAWDNVIFPAAATWTVTINKVSDDSVLATTSPVVS